MWSPSLSSAKIEPCLGYYSNAVSAKAFTTWLIVEAQVKLDVGKVSLHSVADGPKDWIRQPLESASKPEPWHTLANYVDALAYDLSESARLSSFALEQEKPEQLDWWLLCGRFIEQAPFRKRALDYYVQLLEGAKKHNWLEQYLDIIRQRHQEYKQEYDRWHEEREKQKRSQEGKTIYVNPGEERYSKLVRAKSLADRPQAILMFQPEEYRVRFIPPESSDQPYISADPELQVVGPEVLGDAWVWKARHHDLPVRIIWHRTRRVLYVQMEGDTLFVITFKETSPTSGNHS